MFRVRTHSRRVIQGSIIGLIKGDTRSVDYSSYMGEVVKSMAPCGLGLCYTGESKEATILTTRHVDLKSVEDRAATPSPFEVR